MEYQYDDYEICLLYETILAMIMIIINVVPMIMIMITVVAMITIIIIWLQYDTVNNLYQPYIINDFIIHLRLNIRIGEKKEKKFLYMVDFREKK